MASTDIMATAIEGGVSSVAASWSRGFVVAACLWPSLAAAGEAPRATPATGGANDGPAVASAVAYEDAVVAAIARAEASVVAIVRVRVDDLAKRSRVSGSDDPTDPDFFPQEYASGVVIDSAGLILTNQHVLGDPRRSKYFVWRKGRVYAARVKAEDPWLDLALLEIEARNLPAIVLGDASQLRKGQTVILLGNPRAIARDGEASAARGIVANLFRPAAPLQHAPGQPPAPPTLHQYGALIQIDTRLQQGESGGALINLKGEMIGLSTSLAAPSGFDGGAAFAAPVGDVFRRALESLKAGKQPAYGFLGIAPDNLTRQERLQGDVGARVSLVIPGAAAAKAGLQGNDIITRINDTVIIDRNDIMRALGELSANDVANISLRRPDRRGAWITINTTVTLTKKYVSSWRPLRVDVLPPLWRGMRVDDATAIPQFDIYGRAVDPEGCVVVTAVEVDSPAWRADIRSKLFISHVDSERVSSPAAFHAAVAEKEGPVTLRLTERLGGSHERIVNPPEL